MMANQVPGAASARIETARRYFSRIFFNADITERGRDALGWYHEKRSNVWLGQNHDWSSHGADGFGLMCIQIYRKALRACPNVTGSAKSSTDAALGKAHKPLASRE
jgi:hypothetical protein